MAIDKEDTDECSSTVPGMMSIKGRLCSAGVEGWGAHCIVHGKVSLLVASNCSDADVVHQLTYK